MIRALPASAKRDRQFLLELFELNQEIAKYIDDDTYTDEEFWIAVVKARPYYIKHIPLTIPRTRELLLKLVLSNGKVLGTLIDLQRSYIRASLILGDA